jgi:hypothetical protein
MSIIRLIAGLLKAVPVLGRLFSRLADEKKEQKAQKRYEEKLDFIDNAIDKYRRAGVRDGDEAKQREGTDGSPAIPKRRSRRTRVDGGGSKKSSRTGVSPRKKVAKKKPSPKKGDTQLIKKPRRRRKKS